MNPVLTRHRLRHLPELAVDASILDGGFAAGCAVANCDGSCCQWGVYADVAERDKILAHAEVVRRHMDPEQEHDPGRWFETEEFADRDYPSGSAVGTTVVGHGCVFLNKERKCVLQVAGLREGLGPFALKPFYCIAFPITIEEGVLMVDDPEFASRPQCCLMVRPPVRSVVDNCREELEFMLGVEGYEELKQQRR